jgi:RNA polymerase sigma factor (sigma-70 family)
MNTYLTPNAPKGGDGHNPARGVDRGPAVSLTGAASGAEQTEFAARLAEHRGIVYKVANAYCLSPEERDDLVQEICLQLWRSFPRYDRERRFSTWMYRVALNTAISYGRATRARARRLVPLDDSVADGPTAAASANEGDDRAASLHRYLRTLPKLERALVILYLEDRTYREIAEVLGISESNVGTKINRVKTMMRHEMAREQETQRGPR